MQELRQEGFPTMRLVVPSVVDVLYKTLRNEILQGGIPGGSLLTELAVASQYGVARPTAKAALERLIQEGLLRRGTHKSARVPLLTERDVRDLYESRTFFERQVLRLLIRQRAEVPEPTRLAHTRMTEVADHGEESLLNFVKADVEFHCGLVDALASDRTSRMYRQLMGETQLCMAQVQFQHLLDPHVIIDEHKQVLAAIDEGDTDRAVMCIEAHLQNACQHLLERLDTNDGR